MKVVAINGSARRNGNTTHLIKAIFRELVKEDIETELIELAGQNIQNCLACFKCRENKDKECINKNDMLNAIIRKMIESDAIILGSPTYFANVSPEIKAVIDRAGLVGRANDYLYARKIGAAVVSARRAGSTNVFDAINKFFFSNQMIVPGASYWNMAFGMQPGDVNNDEEGLETMKILGQNMAWLMKKILA
jgi:multimeric flavodoxin WrbA